MRFIDLSHTIGPRPNCSFRKGEEAPEFIFLEGSSQNQFFIDLRINNLVMSTGTHICFPGSLPDKHKSLAEKDIIKKNLMDYCLSRFIGKVAILDFSYKYEIFDDFFSATGDLKIDTINSRQIQSYITLLSNFILEKRELESALGNLRLELNSLSGIILYTGLSDFWQNKKFESWNYKYFLTINLSNELCDYLVNSTISFIGIDAPRLGNPLNLHSGYEKLFTAGKDVYDFYKNTVKTLSHADADVELLLHDKLIYKNLNIAKHRVNSVGEFFGVPLNLEADNYSLTRPFIQL